MGRKYNILYERFNNIDQMLKTIESRNGNTVFGNSSEAKTNDESHEKFTRSKSYEEAMSLITNGWEEPLGEIKKGVANGFKSNTTVNKTRPQNGVVGYAPCVPNAILGLPNSMIMTEKTPSKIKAVTVLFSMSVTGDYDQDRILRAGIVVLNIINDLELAGYRVRLDVEFFGSMEGNDICSARVNVKDFRQPLDLKKLAFPISHPSMFRRFGFRWAETFPKMTNRGFRGGYGSSMWKENYQKAKESFEENGLLGKNEYLITTYLCMEKSYNKDKIVQACGLQSVKK